MWGAPTGNSCRAMPGDTSCLQILPHLTILPDTILRKFKFQFVELTIGVTFLFPNKKVTKEVVRGEAFRANSILAPDPTPAAIATAH